MTEIMAILFQKNLTKIKKDFDDDLQVKDNQYQRAMKYQFVK